MGWFSPSKVITEIEAAVVAIEHIEALRPDFLKLKADLQTIVADVEGIVAKLEAMKPATNPSTNK